MAFWSRQRDPALIPAAPGVAAEVARTEREVREAYRRGRLDEKAKRKRHPVSMSIGIALAAVGAIALAVAIVNGGSFTRGGQVMDQNIQSAAQQAQPVAQRAASDASQAVSHAGSDLRQRIAGEPETPPAPPARPQPPQSK
jgi:hypothetical protein